MRNIVLISGSPTAPSQSGTLLEHVHKHIARRGLETSTFAVRDFPAQDLIYAKWDSPAFAEAIAAVAGAPAVVLATPVYKASYSGVLKTFLDVLPQTAFLGKTVLPIMTGGSLAPLLAIDYSLKPVIAALGATDVLQGVYAVDTHFTKNSAGEMVIDEEILTRIERSVTTLLTKLGHEG